MKNPFSLSLLLVSCLFSVAVQAADVAATANVAPDLPASARWLQQGLPGLALAALPVVAPDNPLWLDNESLRWRALAQLQQDDALLQHMTHIPAESRASLAGLLVDLGVPAALRQNQPELALQWLADGIWLGQPNATQFRARRAEVIKAQLAAHDARAAYVSWLRYQQDYSDAETALAEKVTQGLVMSGQVQDALMLSARPGLSASLRLWVQLRAGLLEPAAAVTALSKQRGALDVWYFLTQLEAAKRLQLPGSVIAAQEALLVRFDAATLMPLEVSSGQLWQTYMDYAEQLANQASLLQGQDSDWLALAAQLAGTNPAGQRALLAYIAARGASVESRDAAAESLLGCWRDAQLGRLAVLAPDLQLSDKGRWAWGYAAYEQKELSSAGHWWAALTPELAVNDWPLWPLARLQALQANRQWDEARALMGGMSFQTALAPDATVLALDIAQRWVNAGYGVEAQHWLQQVQAVLDGAAWREAQRWRGRLALQQHDYAVAAVAYLAAADAGGRPAEVVASRRLAAEALWQAGLTDDAKALQGQLDASRSERK